MGEKKIICDTDVMIDYLNINSDRYQNSKYILEEIIGIENVNLSSITKMELLIGANNKNNLSKLIKNIHFFEIFLINNEITEVAVELLQTYNLSHGLALPDSFIAATSLTTNSMLFTYNVKDYKFIKGLTLFHPEHK